MLKYFFGQTSLVPNCNVVASSIVSSKHSTDYMRKVYMKFPARTFVLEHRKRSNEHQHSFFICLYLLLLRRIPALHNIRIIYFLVLLTGQLRALNLPKIPTGYSLKSFRYTHLKVSTITCDRMSPWERWWSRNGHRHVYFHHWMHCISLLWPVFWIWPLSRRTV